MCCLSFGVASSGSLFSPTPPNPKAGLFECLLRLLDWGHASSLPGLCCYREWIVKCPTVKSVSLKTARRSNISNRGYYHLANDIKVPVVRTGSWKLSHGIMVVERIEGKAHLLAQDGLSVEVPSQLPWDSTGCFEGPSLMMLPSVCLSIRTLPSLQMDAVGISWMMFCYVSAASVCYMVFIYYFTFSFLYTPTLKTVQNKEKRTNTQSLNKMKTVAKSCCYELSSQL